MSIKKEIKKESLSNKLIVICLFILIAFLEAIWTLMNSFKKGFRKKEVLSKSSELGFDFEIIVK